MRDKQSISVALLFGGTSREHEVSLLSAQRVYRSLKELPYQIVLIGISTSGRWYLQTPNEVDDCLSQKIIEDEEQELLLAPTKGFVHAITSRVIPVDVIVPLTHGKMGEDGIVQSVLTLLNIPYIGSSPLTSMICMQKSLTKELLASWGVPIVPFIPLNCDDLRELLDHKRITENIEKLISIHHYDEKTLSVVYDYITTSLGSSIVIKPDDEGSSIGVQVLKNFSIDQLYQALVDHIKQFDSILIETYIQQMVEVECALFFEKEAIISEPKIIENPNVEQSLFLTYEQKYTSEHPYHISEKETLPRQIEKTIKESCSIISQRLMKKGFARVDFFYQAEEQKVYFNEINTIPGLTESSIFPVLVKESGWELKVLLDHLIYRSVSNED